MAFRTVLIMQFLSDSYDFSSLVQLIVLYTVFPNKLCSSCSVRQQVPHSYKTMDKFIVSSYFNLKLVH